MSKLLKSLALAGMIGCSVGCGQPRSHIATYEGCQRIAGSGNVKLYFKEGTNELSFFLNTGSFDARKAIVGKMYDIKSKDIFGESYATKIKEVRE